jgi:predicted metalloendopeptidase
MRIAMIIATALLLSCGPSKTTNGTTGPNPDPNPNGTIPGTDPDPDLTKNAEPQLVQKTLDELGVESTYMDPNADACVDFYQYACGGWLAANEVPADKARFGSFDTVSDRNEQALYEILEGLRADKGAKGKQGMLGGFYDSCMDDEAIEKSGTTGIDPLLAIVKKIDGPKTLAKALTELHRHGIYAVFDHSAYPDFADSKTNILFVDSAGLGLPDRDYYPASDKKHAAERKAYKAHVQAMFKLLGYKTKAARTAASDVMSVETALAEVTKTRVERRDVGKLYNPMDLDGLAKLAPRFPWKDYLATLGLTEVGKLSVTTPKYVQAFNKMIKSVSSRKWRNYLTWQIVHSTAETLPTKFQDEAFNLTKTLTGQEKLRDRWKRCVSATGSAMPEFLGELYVDKMFGGGSKEAAEMMTKEIGEAFRVVLANISWMSADTVKQANSKLDNMSSLIGHPTKWKTYEFEVVPGNYAANALAATAFELARDLKKAGQPVDREEWLMPAYLVNAYYNPLNNQMGFPAGILQPPFFGVDRSVAANLGGMGMVVGHELTHGFDDSGARFDEKGNMRNWWQPEDEAKFKERGQCVVDQYNTYEALPGLKVNGKLTLGENIADLGGSKLAFHAYKNIRKGAKEFYQAGDVTEDQVFFIATGQAWCSKARDAEIERRITVDSHSPPNYRVFGSLSSLPEFAEAFSCQQGTPMNPADRCEVW